MDDFVGGAHAFRSAALHEALEILRAMFAGEVDGALRHAFITAEGRILPDLPIGIGTEEVRIEHGYRERGTAVPLVRDARKHRLELAQKESKGLAPAVLMARAGHSSFKTTQGYIDLAGQAFREEAERVEERIFGVSGHVKKVKHTIQRMIAHGLERRRGLFF